MPKRQIYTRHGDIKYIKGVAGKIFRTTKDVPPKIFIINTYLKIYKGKYVPEYTFGVKVTRGYTVKKIRKHTYLVYPKDKDLKRKWIKVVLGKKEKYAKVLTTVEKHYYKRYA